MALQYRDHGSVLAYCLGAPAASAHLRAAAGRLGARTVQVTMIQPLDRRLLLGAAAAVVDLAPWDAQVFHAVEVMQRIVPGLTLVLYYPDTPPAIDAAARLGSRPGILCKMQMLDPDEPRRLAQILRRCVAEAPGARFAANLQGATAVRHAPLLQFLGIAVRRMTEGWEARPGVAALAGPVGISQRQLQRAFKKAGWPAPRLSLDWLCALWTTWIAARTGLAESAAAEHLALTRRDWKRLLDRLGQYQTDGVSAFEGLLTAFVKQLRRIQRGPPGAGQHASNY